ncbi:hypothetical protein ACRBEV_24945 [Methylobacterium phyllosphaerae]
MALNPATGAVGFLDGSRDPAEWLRNVAKGEPSLLTRPATETATATPAPAKASGPQPFRHSAYLTVAPGTVSADMAAAKADPAARAALLARLNLTR